MKQKELVKLFFVAIMLSFVPILLLGQTQYDYYDDGAVAGGVDRALKGFIIIGGIIAVVIVLLLILYVVAKVYLWFNPVAKPEHKRTLAATEKEREEFERVQSDDIKKEKERKEHIWGKVVITLGIILGSFVLIGLVLNICQDIIEKKEKKELYEKTHPLMSVTSLENRKSVNLGLSVDWATCNIGANSPIEQGNLYGWGDTSGIIYFGRSSSKDYQDEPVTDDLYTFAYPTRKDYIPPLTIVGTEYDIALQCWGKEWRMPTWEEARELIDRCNFFVRNNYIVAIGPSGDSVQFPFGSSICMWYATGDLGNLGTKYINAFFIRNEIGGNGIALTDGNGNYIIEVAMGIAERTAMLPVRAVRTNSNQTYIKH